MNLDNLISKYLDGELTHQEDLYLRELISNDDLARDKFNSYVDIHLAAKQDSKDIEIPEDLVSDTEDKVLMMMMDQTPGYAQTTKGGVILNSFSFKITSMVAAILIIAVLPISDMNFFNRENLSENQLSNPSISLLDIKVPETNLSELNNESNKSEPENNSHAIAKTQVPSLEFSQSDINFKNLQSDKVDISKTENNSDYVSESISLNQDVEKQINFKEESDRIKNIISSKPVSVNLASPVANSFTSMNLDENITSGSMNNITVSNVEVNTTAYAPVSVSGFAPEANASISSFSQSMALVLNKDEKFGVEIGFSDLNYVAENTTFIKVYDKYGRYTGEQLITKTQSDRDFSLYWGSLFYQRDIFEYKDFNLNMRLGAGLTNEGPTANTRLVASYEIVNGVSITAGADLNYFNVELPFLINRRTNHYTSFSTIYGVQFNF